MMRFGNFSNLFMWMLGLRLDWSVASPDTFMENYNFVREWKHDSVVLKLNALSIMNHTAKPLPLKKRSGKASAEKRRKLRDYMSSEFLTKIPKPKGWKDSGFDWRSLVEFKTSDFQHTNECFAESAGVTMDALYQLSANPREEEKRDAWFNADHLALCSGHSLGDTGLPEDVFSAPNKRWTPKSGCHPTNGETAIELARPPIVLCDLSGDDRIENQLEGLLKLAPVTVAVPSSNRVFKNYKSGILEVRHMETYSNVPDHAVALVGFGSEKGKRYWTLKNSWGPDWGEEGYFRVERKHDGSGILGSYAAVTKTIS